MNYNKVIVADSSSQLKQKKNITPIISCVSGAIAGGVEGAVTYPFEFTKTRVQLRGEQGGRNPFSIMRGIVKAEGVSGLYVGCSTLVAGTALKASVRFMSFDAIKGFLADERGHLTTEKALFAGMIAGCVESLVAVTPTERIKTALIDDARSVKRYQSALHAARLLVQEQGVSNLYKGLVSTTLKQCATSAVRMGSYTTIKQAWNSQGLPQNSIATFGIGSAAGIITVYASQPFDVIKSRTQSVRGAGNFEAIRSIWVDSGTLGFWKGSTMRLGRLVLSGGIVFTAYEKISQVLQVVLGAESS